MSKGTTKPSFTKGTPIEAKEDESVDASIFDMDNRLLIDPALIEEMERKGLAYRWVNAIKLKENHGFDARQWKPYKREKSEGLENNFFGGTDSEGYTRRADLILCARPRKVHEQVKARNQSKIDALAGNHRQATREQLQEAARERGIKSRFMDTSDDDSE